MALGDRLLGLILVNGKGNSGMTTHQHGCKEPTCLNGEHTDMHLIRAYFFSGEPISVFSPEYKALTTRDRSQLATAIRDGSGDYDDD